tara:strand:+ start:7574 stop:8038 length:465 start_codon:yes stop_codon:yes gene_type:complete
MAEIKITWKKSCIGFPSKQERIIESLGLKRLHHSVIHQDSPTIMGMVNKVTHLVQVEPVTEQTQPSSKGNTQAKKVAPKAASPVEKETVQVDKNTESDGSIDSLGLSVRTLNILKKSDVSTIEQIAKMTDDELLALPSFGAKSLDEVKEKLGAA